MPIVELSGSNFKSFTDFKIDLGRLNIFVGPNASGKSNLIQVFSFLRGISAFGLKSSINGHGGPKYISNLRSDSDETSISLRGFQPTSPQLILGQDPSETVSWNKNPGFDSEYHFRIKIDGTSGKVQVLEDSLKLKFLSKVPIGQRRLLVPPPPLTKPDILVSHGKGKLLAEAPASASIPPSLRSLRSFMEMMETIPVPDNMLLLESPLAAPFIQMALFDLLNASFFSIEPARVKQPTKTMGPPVLDSSGSNLAFVLNAFLQNKSSHDRLLALVRDLMPYVSDVRSEQAFDNLLLHVAEGFSREEFLPAPLMSDGTVTALALIVALYFENKPFLLVEEPERNLHPKVLSRMVSMMHDVSKQRQLLITTHSSEVVKWADVSDLILMTRDSNGNSVMTRPASNDAVRSFLKEEVSLDELHVQNLLGP
jgi:predicted ATPase